MTRLSDSTAFTPKLTEAGEAAWTEFRYHVEWSRGFALIYLFSSYRAVTALFLSRLRDVCKNGVSAVQLIAAKDPERLAEAVLATLRDPPQKYADLAAPIWIDAAASIDPRWLNGCDLLLARLNEHRDMLRANIRRAVVISLPGGYRKRAQEIAPDLWAVRNYSLDLNDIRPLEAVGAPETETVTVPEKSYIPSIPSGEALLKEWARLSSLKATGRETMLAGWRAAQAALALGRLADALRIAEATLGMARQAVTMGQTETALRDLSVALDSVGDIASRRGDFEEAGAAYRESLEIRRTLRKRVGDTPETLRDLSVSLNNVGDIAGRLGDFEEAGAAYRESLEICRALPKRVGDTPETLRDLSVSLNNVGDIDRRLGNIQKAEAAWSENLKLLRRLSHAFPASDEYREMLERTEKRLGELSKDNPDY
ncbi:MAG: tetratricopeptide repeat protein [Syntrophobacteraceae bacterium]|nr:tetratricopeptide repeat protein [Syntrophobacteraceae bacterium]